MLFSVFVLRLFSAVFVDVFCVVFRIFLVVVSVSIVFWFPCFFSFPQCFQLCYECCFLHVFVVSFPFFSFLDEISVCFSQ